MPTESKHAKIDDSAGVRRRRRGVRSLSGEGLAPGGGAASAVAAIRMRAWLGAPVGRKGQKSYRLRIFVQSAFALLCIFLGFELARFLAAAERGALPLPARPAGVEGFLPISGLMGLVDWIRRGELNPIHPAATVILLLALAVAFFLRKSFCSWVCPVGFLSDLLARLGRRLFGRTYRPWRWLDFLLRGAKYFLLFFFLQAILRMSAAALANFLDSPYNRVADLKMGLFFVELSPFGWGVIALLALLSAAIHGFWCRYLCPYGALLGLFSWFSPARIVRVPEACIDCGLCDRVCAARLPVSERLSVLNAECTGCLDCVAVCPAAGALDLRLGKRRLGVAGYAVLLLALFLGGYASARLAGAWENQIPDAEYIERAHELRTSRYAHPGVS